MLERPPLHVCSWSRHGITLLIDIEVIVHALLWLWRRCRCWEVVSTDAGHCTIVAGAVRYMGGNGLSSTILGSIKGKTL